MEKKGIAAVIYDHNGTHYFLILHRVLDWEGWEFMKGEFKEDEEWSDAILREVVKETGLTKFSAKKKLDKEYRYTRPDGVVMSYDVYLIETSMNIPVSIKENDQHDTYLWATYESAQDKLTFPEQKRIFEIAYEEIKNIQKNN